MMNRVVETTHYSGGQAVDLVLYSLEMDVVLLLPTTQLVYLDGNYSLVALRIQVE